MDLDAYQRKAQDTAVFPESKTIEYLLLGLSSEVGELHQLYKKYYRNDDISHSEVKERAMYELGDILWYVAMAAKAHGLSLNMVANTNLSKLSDRKKRGTLKGSGENR